METRVVKKISFLCFCLILVLSSTNLICFSAVTADSELYLGENPIPPQLNSPPSPYLWEISPYNSYKLTVSPTPDFSMGGYDYDNDRLTFKLEILQDDVVILTFNQVQDNTGWNKTDYASGEIATFTMPDSYALPDGDYEWQVFAFDGHQWSEDIFQSAPFKVEALPGKVELVAQVEGGFKDVFVQGDYAYAISNRELLILDVSNPAQPIECSSFPLIIPSHICVSGSYAYLTGVGLGLKVVDVSDPFRPVEKGTTDSTYDKYGAENLYISGSYVFVAAWDFGLRVIDISNPETPIEIGNYNEDICPPGMPPEYFSYPMAIWDVYVSNPYAYAIGDFFWLYTIDISNPVLPVLVSTYSVPSPAAGGASCVYISDSYAYIGVGSGFGVRIADVSNPMEPVDAGYCDPQIVYEPFGIANCKDIYISQSYAYLAHDFGMLVLDISVPTEPQIAGWYNTWNMAGATEPRAVHTSGSYIYMADYEAGLLILQFKELQPDSPTLISPDDGAIVTPTPTFIINSTDPKNDILQYKIEILQSNLIVRTFDQTQETTGWDSNQYTTNQLATFTVPENQALSIGTYQWRAYAHNGTEWSPASQTRSFNITEGTLSISGRVVSVLREPIEGALVEALEGNYKWSTQTDVNGLYIIDGLLAGSYDVRISYVYRPTLTRCIELEEDENADMDEIVLWPEPGELVQKYAPVLYFHSEEKYRPMPVELFLDHATINGLIARHSVAQDPNVGEYMDLEGSQSQEYEQLFNKYKDSYYGYNPDTPIVYARVYTKDQYYVVQYWFFYLYNPTVDPPVLPNPPYPLPNPLVWLSHEGDWEMIQLIWTDVNNLNEPAYAVYSCHENIPHPPWKEWKDVEKYESTTHPCVYVGWNSHASYFDNGLLGVHLLDYTGTYGPFHATPILLPHEDNHARPQEQLTSEKWTLFPRRWGANILDLLTLTIDSPTGPAHKGDQWNDPIKWSEIDLP